MQTHINAIGLKANAVYRISWNEGSQKKNNWKVTDFRRNESLLMVFLIIKEKFMVGKHENTSTGKCQRATKEESLTIKDVSPFLLL